MAYRLPDFPLLGSIYRSTTVFDFAAFGLVGSTICQLRGYGQLQKAGTSNPLITQNFAIGWAVLCPPLTDVRDADNAAGLPDLIEVPSGSGRYYAIHLVDDIAKGFPNEYRIAIVGKPSTYGNLLNAPLWPTPIP